MTTGINVPSGTDSMSASVPSVFQFEVMYSGVADEAAEAPRGALTSGSPVVILSLNFTPSEAYVAGEKYPVLARIWDNEEDDAAFASL